MKIPIKKTTCAALAGAVLLSMTGCSTLPIGEDNSEEEIVDAATLFVKAAADCNLDKMSKVSVEDFGSDTEDWEDILDFKYGTVYDANAARFADAVADTIEYEIDEDSAEVDKDTASVEVVFSIVDYGSVLEGTEYADIDEMLEALDDADTEEIKVTIEFELEDDEWLVSNYEDIMKDLYEFTDTQSLEFGTTTDVDWSDVEMNDSGISDDDQGSIDPIDTDTFYNFEDSMQFIVYRNTYGCEEMYEAFEEYAVWDGTTAVSEQVGIYDSGVSEIRFVQYSNEDLGDIGVCVTYSPVSNADFDEVDFIFTNYISSSVDADGNVYYEVVIEAPADGYYMIEMAPTVADLLEPVVTGACRVGDTNY